MEESKHYQPVNPGFDLWRSETTTHTGQEPPPPLISKKWLCWRFELVQPSGRPNYGQLYRKVLTPRVIAAIGATPEEIRAVSVRTFTREQTIVLIRLLDL